VPQAQLGFFPFTVREVVLMGRTARIGLFHTPSSRDIEMAEELLRLLGIDHLADRPYTEVSGGERQLALIARALAQEPQVLVMDEPTASLDFGNQVRVMSEIKALASRGIAVILSTHDPDQAFLCAQRVAILHRGRLAYSGQPQEVITPAVLRAVYGVEVEIVKIESGAGEKHLICLPSFARLRSNPK
jgi:iron complex transport system ATP-binding protein